MDIVVNATEAADTSEAIGQLLAPVRERPSRPDFLAVHTSSAHNIALIRAMLSDAGLPHVHGATTCQGVMAGGAMVRDNGRGIGCFALWDPDGSFGTALATLDRGAFEAGRDATIAALRDAGRAGEAPDLIWISAAPGREEDIVRGIESVVGTNTPIVGGSAADNDITGGWRVFDKERVAESAVVVSVLFPSRPLSTAYQNGYAPDGHSGIVTRADGRVIQEIDHRRAADIYAEWTAGRVAIPNERPAQILAASTFHPLGRAVTNMSGVPFYVLAHPAVVRDDGGLELFCAIDEGERVHLMAGSPESLTSRAGRVASLALFSGQMRPAEIAGALVIYCGGCMLAVGEDMDEVARDVDDALGGAPSLGIFTFGEQGVVFNGENHHGNLMISCVAFSR